MADDPITDGCTTEELHALHPNEADMLPGLSEVEYIEPYPWATEVDIPTGDVQLRQDQVEHVDPYGPATEVDVP